MPDALSSTNSATGIISEIEVDMSVFPSNRYLALKKRQGHKKAIIAIARMLLTAIYNMLKKNEAYNPELLPKGRPATCTP